MAVDHRSAVPLIEQYMLYCERESLRHKGKKADGGLPDYHITRISSGFPDKGS